MDLHAPHHAKIALHCGNNKRSCRHKGDKQKHGAANRGFERKVKHLRLIAPSDIGVLNATLAQFRPLENRNYALPL
jgi:hypothetical protein